ncbi:hypothetical protein M5689_010966 [Euphorbia peplus]|nr:hypothetical protein M5689_010966 [Euphorbia peplus]
MDEESPNEYICETTLSCNGRNDKIEEKLCIGERHISENFAMNDAVWKCLKYLVEKKGVFIKDYNSDALVEKKRQLEENRQQMEMLRHARTYAYNIKKNKAQEGLDFSTFQLVGRFRTIDTGMLSPLYG